MEANGHERMLTVCLLEFFGVALFAFGVLNSNDGASIPFSLIASCIIFGDVTGGHMNPAITIAVFTSLGSYSKNILFACCIILSQFAGGIAGVGLSWLGNYNQPYTLAPVLAPRNPVTRTFDNNDMEGDFEMDLAVMWNEVIGTFLFASMVLLVKGKHTAGERKGVCAGMHVAATLLAVISGTNSLGSCINPAIGVSVAVNSVLKYRHHIPSTAFMTHYTYAYTVGPAIGGLLAGLFHLIHAKFHEPDPRETA